MHVCRSVPRKRGMQSNLPAQQTKTCSRSLVMVAGVMAPPSVLCASARSNDTDLCLGQLTSETLHLLNESAQARNASSPQALILIDNIVTSTFIPVNQFIYYTPY